MSQLRRDYKTKEMAECKPVKRRRKKVKSPTPSGPWTESFLVDCTVLQDEIKTVKKKKPSIQKT